MKVISLRDALAFMDSGQPFSLSFVKADRKRETGGEIVSLENVRQHKKEFYDQDKHAQPIDEKNDLKLSRNPKHLEHGTRNLRLSSGKIRKVHIRLIVKFNGAKVVY